MLLELENIKINNHSFIRLDLVRIRPSIIQLFLLFFEKTVKKKEKKMEISMQFPLFLVWPWFFVH